MRSIRMSKGLHAYIINSTQNKAPWGIKLEVDFLIEKLGFEILDFDLNTNFKNWVSVVSGRVHTLSAPGVHRRENEILESKVQIENKKFKIKK